MSEWAKSIESPQVVTNLDSFEWDKTCDMVVVGLGGAGVSAAIEGLDRGLTVLGIDRFEGGGATKASGGVIYLGGGTSTQSEANVEDTWENMYAYLKQEVGDIVSDQTLKAFCESSVENETWLTERGVRFEPKLWSKKTSYPNAEYFLYHSDNSLIEPYNEKALPAARGHRGWVPIKQGRKAMGLGWSIFEPLRDYARKKGLKELQFAEVTQLVTDSNNRVIGVKVKAFPKDSSFENSYRQARRNAERWMTMYPPILPGAKFFFRRGMFWAKKAASLLEKRIDLYIQAKRGVVISAGGFAFNRKMMQEHVPKFSTGYPLGTEGDDGAGITLGKSVGGKVGNMSRATAWRFINPPYAFAKGIIVNKAGHRFINEMKYGAHIGVEIGENQNGEAWLVLDQKLVKHAISEVKGSKVLSFQRDLARLNIWFASHAGTLESVSEKIGINFDDLRRTIVDYNLSIDRQASDRFHKSLDDRASLNGPKFYAIDIGLTAKLFPCPVLTLGGLEVDPETGTVLREDGSGNIEGLYAAGRSAVGICSNNYVSGLSIADCVFSGRRAGRNV